MTLRKSRNLSAECRCKTTGGRGVGSKSLAWLHLTDLALSFSSALISGTGIPELVLKTESCSWPWNFAAEQPMERPNFLVKAVNVSLDLTVKTP